MKTATVCRIRPISWKVTVQTEQAAQYVRDTLRNAGAECSPLQQEPELQDPPLFTFLAKLGDESSLTSVELRSLLEKDENIELAFDR